MDAILRITNEKILPVLETWDAVDAVVVLTFGSDRYDPSFFISYDVYHTGAIPGKVEREAAFGFAAAFESTRDCQKDRILIEDVPVRFEYKDVGVFDTMLAETIDTEHGDPLTSTYGLFRLERGKVLLQRSSWLADTRKALAEIPESFWTRKIAALRARMDHVLADLSGAVYTGEVLFYQLSLASFLNTLSRLLFAINHRFEPAERLLNEQLHQLPILPDQFATRLEYLLRSDSAINDKRKREIAELVTWSVLRLA